METRRKFVQQMGVAMMAAPLITENFTASGAARPSAGKADDSSAGTTADIIVERLIAWNVDTIFDIIGDGINPIIEALRKRKDKIKFITVRHEEAAALMASAYAKYTGKIGACIGTSGPGAVHLMNGIYDASMENAPVIAITGAVFHDVAGTQYTQEVDMVKLMENATVYNQQISGPRQALTVVDLACRAALNTPGVAHLTVSKDTQMKPLSTDKTSKGSENLKGSAGAQARIELPTDGELDTAAELLNQSAKITILAGRGALNARKELEQLAEKLGAPVAKALLGKAVLADDSPLTTGGTGNLGTMPSKQAMEECDMLLIVGSNMPYLEYYPTGDHARAIQIDRDPKRIGLRYPVTLGLTGDTAATLKALLPKIKYHSDRSFLQQSQQRMKEWKNLIAQVESRRSQPIKPQFLVANVSRLLKDDAVISIDTGAHTVFTARHWQIRHNQQLALSGNLATMAAGLPYIIAAQVAFPGRQCVAMVGDGGFAMLMAEMATAVHYNLPVKVVVFKNGILSMDKFEQQELGNPNYGDELQDIDFVAVAKACGAEGYRCANSSQVESTLRQALSSTKPAVLEVLVDPAEKPAKPEEVKA